jgi:endonuclease/exonuclease/phosphatase family metal-dependent hydrolase
LNRRATPARWWLAWGGVAAAALGALLLRLGGDVWWPVFPFLFGPRWIALPLLICPLPLLVTRPKAGVVPAGLTTVLVLAGILGMRVGPARLGLPPSGSPSFRLVEYNMAVSTKVTHDILQRLDSLGAQVATLVECPSYSEVLRPPAGWNLRSAGELCFLSRFPIVGWDVRSQDDIYKLHGKLAIAKATIVIGGENVTIALLHLKSPRDALIEFRYPSAWPGLRTSVDSISAIRNLESHLAIEFLSPAMNGPIIVAGDFNTPEESRIYSRWWSSFSDAFEEAGAGTGYSWHSRWHGIRIDHILMNGGFAARRTWIGPDLGSDHVPVIADLVLRPQRTRTAR